MPLHPSVTKVVQGRTLIRCNCDICSICWFDPGTGYCIVGGPYTGYEVQCQDPPPTTNTKT